MSSDLGLTFSAELIDVLAERVADGLARRIAPPPGPTSTPTRPRSTWPASGDGFRIWLSGESLPVPGWPPTAAPPRRPRRLRRRGRLRLALPLSSGSHDLLDAPGRETGRGRDPTATNALAARPQDQLVPALHRDLGIGGGAFELSQSAGDVSRLETHQRHVAPQVRNTPGPGAEGSSFRRNSQAICGSRGIDAPRRPTEEITDRRADDQDEAPRHLQAGEPYVVRYRANGTHTLRTVEPWKRR